MKIINAYQIERRNFWVNEISRLSGNFGVDAEKVGQDQAKILLLEIFKTVDALNP